MKSLIGLLSCLMLAFVASAQQEVSLSEERMDNQVYVYAENNSNSTVELKILAEIHGYTAEVSFPYTVRVDANSKALAFVLTQISGVEQSYNLSVSYSVPRANPIKATSTEHSKTTGIEINPSKINIFTKDGCGRCSFATKYLNDKNIPYLELNTSIHYPNSTLMFNKLEEAGFKGGSVTMPVIVYQDKVYYNISNIAELLESLGGN